MKCGICHQSISKADREANRYTTSSWTGAHYHARDCDTPALKAARIAAQAPEREARRKAADEKLAKKRKRRGVGR